MLSPNGYRRPSADRVLLSAIASLPLDMMEIMETLATHTGGEFYMIGAWDGGEHGMQYFE
jgi:hypothetical protein